MTCRNPVCRAKIPLLSSFWLVNSTRRKAWVRVSGKSGVIGIKVMQGTRPPDAKAADCGMTAHPPASAMISWWTGPEPRARAQAGGLGQMIARI
jgi:hypothetical protein